ncbi:hypothetical protein AgCh_024081 [Apium graveolens]
MCFARLRNFDWELMGLISLLDSIDITCSNNADAAAFATTPAPHLNFGVVNPAASMIQSIDPWLNQPTFYMKSGECKFGERCKFHHPINRFSHTQLAKESQQGNLKLTLAAMRTPGFSGADLANLLNEAAILADRRGKTGISSKEIDDSIDRIVAGREGTVMTDGKSKSLVAYHEVGHAICGDMWWVVGSGTHSVVGLDVINGIRADSQNLDASSCRRWGHEGWWYYPTMAREMTGVDGTSLSGDMTAEAVPNVATLVVPNMAIPGNRSCGKTSEIQWAGFQDVATKDVVLLDHVEPCEVLN